MDRLSWTALLAVVAVAGCGGHGRPKALVDGTKPGRSPAALHAVRGAVLTRTQVLHARMLDPSERRACPELRSAGDPLVVRRTGLEGTSLTFEDRAEGGVLGCDGTPGRHELPGPWCGVAAGKLVSARLLDPRLEIGCRRRGKTVAFAWINSLPGARWIGIDEGDAIEVYRAAAGLPVRVASSRSVAVERSSASFHVTQYASDGRLLSKTTLGAAVAR